MTVALTEDDVDKTVVDAAGEAVGTVVDVQHGAAHVSADEETVAELKTRLPQGSIDEGTYAVGDESVAEITDDRLVLDVEA
jgi:anti-sigma28 factor (negative regulator of flagellin synthesis)